ncbi:immediate early response gene 2 protein [Spea bombifrons]|uniref:immediate early response gene 2 protein n=1 Tax=Spea bombifrons TaxID=233779 RepID=UPI002349146B|nr:immediate early response gene 2 protein [Spea bombifrons]
MEVQYLSHQEAVHREAQRIASLSAWKLLRSRSQRGGMRLHRSLQLALVMRSARELLISSAPEPKAAPPPAAAAAARESRKRRSCGSQVAELVPYKRACLWQETPQPQLQEGAFPGLAQVLQKLLMSSQVVGRCRALGTGHIPGVNTRAVEAF